MFHHKISLADWRGLFYEYVFGLISPVASDHCQIRASFCAEIGDLVVTAVDVSKSLVERYIKHCQLVVVAEDTLQECLVRQCELSKVVVRAVNELELRALVYCKGGKIVVRAYQVEKVLAVHHCKLLHVVVRADECAQLGQICETKG